VTNPLIENTGVVAAAAVGVAGLLVTWRNSRAERSNGRLERLIEIEREAKERGPVRIEDTDASADAHQAHQQFLRDLDREIRVQQVVHLNSTRRVTGGASTGAGLYCLAYGALLIWMAFSTSPAQATEITTGATTTAGWIVAAVLLLAGLSLVVSGTALLIRRYVTRAIRKTIGLRDTYSVATLRKAISVMRDLKRGPHSPNDASERDAPAADSL